MFAGEGSMKKQIYINMASQIVSFAVSVLIGFFLTPYLVENIGSEAYGFIGLADNFISYALLITTALNSMASRFITISIHREEIENVNKYYSSVIFANLFLSVVFAAIASVVLLNIENMIDIPEKLVFDVTLLWGLLFLNFLINLVGNIFGIATFAYNRLELASLRTVEANLLKVVILVTAFSLFKPCVWYMGLSAIICSIYTIGINVYYTKKFMPYVRIKKKYFDFSKIKVLIFSGVWNSISKLSSILSTGLDLLITNLFVNASAMGTVAIAKVLPSYVLSLFGTVSNAFSPQLTISYAQNDFQDIKKQLISAIRLLGFFAAIPVVCLWVFAGDFFELWMPTQNSQTLHTLLILSSLAFPFALPLETLWNIFTVTNKVKKSSLFLMTNAFASVVITYAMLLNTQSDVVKMCIVCGVSSVVSVVRALTFLPIYGAKCLKFKWYTFYGIIAKNSLTFAVSLICALVIKKMLVLSGWFGIVLSVLVTSAIVCIINYYLMLTKGERKTLWNLIKKEKEK